MLTNTSCVFTRNLTIGWTGYHFSNIWWSQRKAGQCWAFHVHRSEGRLVHLNNVSDVKEIVCICSQIGSGWRIYMNDLACRIPLCDSAERASSRSHIPLHLCLASQREYCGTVHVFVDEASDFEGWRQCVGGRKTCIKEVVLTQSPCSNTNTAVWASCDEMHDQGDIQGGA